MEKKLLSVILPVFFIFLSSWSGFGQCSETNPPTVSITSSDADNIICAGESVTFTATPQNAGNNRSFQWRINGVNQGSNGTSNTFTTSNLQNGHIVTVVLTPDCAGATTATSNNIATQVNAIPSPPTITGDNSVCAGDNINLSASTISGATYNWTGPNGFTFTGKDLTRTGANSNMQGTYTVTATVNNCTSSAGSINLTVNPIPGTPTPGNNGPVCAGGTFNLTANTITGASYSWTGPNGYTSNVQNPSLTGATAAMSGTYTVTATVNECTSVAATTTVVVNAAPAAPTADNGGAVCVGGTIGLTASSIANATYSWTGPNNFASTQQNPNISNATAAMAGTYSVIATVSGCPSSAATTNVTVNAIPTAPTAGNAGAICVGGTINLTATTVTGATYSWTGPGGFTSTQQNPSRTGATTAMQGTYSVTATVNNCTSPAGTTNIIVNTIPAAPTANNAGPVCVGGTINLTATTVTGATYSWTGPNNFTSNEQNPTRSGATTAMAGVYSVTATVDGCTSSASTTTAIVNTIPNAPTAGSNSAVCSGGTINLTASTIANAIYSWTGPGGFTSALQNPSRTVATSAMAGTYNVTATVNGCTSPAGTTSVTITPTVTPSVSITSSTTNICSSNGAPVTFTAIPVNGGTTPTYQWRRNGSNITGATGSTYTVNSLASPSTISVVMTSNATCASPGTATSNDIVMTVYTSAPSTPNGQGASAKPIGPDAVCPGPAANNLKYTIPSGMTQTAEYYTWNLPPGFNIIAGSGTREITVSVPGAGAVSGNNNISVTAYNPCGNSGSSTALVVRVGSFAAVDVGADLSICLGTDLTLINNLSGSANNVTWAVINGAGNISGGPYPAPFIYKTTTSGVATLRAITNTATGSCSASTGIDDLIVTTNQPPVITTQPIATQTMCSGNSATFTVSATGTGLTYQWRKDGTNISGATASTLTLNNITSANAGNYTVVVSGTSPCTSATSSVSELKINEAVSITTQPVATQTLCSGSSTTLSVAATGTGLSYQWKKGGTNINGATQASLTLSNTTTSDSGEYTVEVSGTNPCLPVTSSPSTLTINEVVTITTQPEPTQVLCAATPANFTVVATGTGLTYQWKKDGNNINGANAATLNIQNPTSSDSGNYTVEVSGTNPCAPITSSVAALTVNSPSVAPTSLSTSASSICNGANTSVTLSQTGGNLGTGAVWKWHTDANYSTPVTGTVANDGSITLSPTTTTTYYLRVENTAGPCTAVVEGPSAGVTVTVNEPSVAPTALSASAPEICNGDNTTVTLTKTGGSLGTNAIWKWFSDANYTIPVTGTVDNDGSMTVSPTTTTTYYIRAENNAGPCDVNVNGPASGVTVTVNEPVVITADLDDSAAVSVCAGFAFEFEIEATGTDLTYQWQLNDRDIPGANNAKYSVSQAASSNAGLYKVIVSGSGPCIDVTSNEVELIVNQSITINTQPAPSIQSCEGDSNPITITVTATGTTSEYLWRKNNIPLSNGNGISGVDGPTLTIQNQTAEDSGSYDVVISSPAESCSQIISNPSVVTVNLAPKIDSIGENIEICSVGEEVNITSGVGVSNESSIEWSVPAGMGTISNSTQLTGATYTPNGASGTITLTLKVQGLDGCSEISETKTITIIPQPVLTAFTYTSTLTDTATEFCETDTAAKSPTIEGNNLANGTGEFTVDKPALVVNSNSGAFTPNGTDPDVYIITYTFTPTSNSGVCAEVSRDFTVTIGANPVADFSYDSEIYCKDTRDNNFNTAPVISFDEAGHENVDSFTVNSSNLAIDAATGAIDLSNSSSGTYTITRTVDYKDSAEDGCQPVTAEFIITINDRPIPDFTYSATEFCSNDDNITAQLGTGAVLGMFSEKDGEAGLVFANTGTGEIDLAGSTPGTYTVVNTVNTEGDGCDAVTAEFTLTIKKLPNAAFSYSAAAYCKSSSANQSPNITGDVGGVFTASAGLVINANGVIDVAASTANDPNDDLDVHTVTYTFASDGICEEVSTTINVRIDAPPVGGKLAFANLITTDNDGRIFTICQGATSGYLPITLSNYAGNILAWKYSINGAPWITIAGQTGDVLPAAEIQALNLQQTTVFRVEISSGACTPNVFSQTAILSVIATDIKPTPVTVSKDVVCLGEEVTLSSETGYSTGNPVNDGGSFDNAGIKNQGWRFTRPNGSEFNFETNANNTNPDVWSRATPRAFPTANLSSPYTNTNQVWDPAVEDGNKGFAIVSGTNSSRMETAIFGITSMDQAILTFDQAYNLTPGASITVEISTNGGASYETILFSRSGAISSANYGSFGTGTPQTRPNNKMVIDLGNYMGQNNLRIRFSYVGARTGDIWAVDAIKIPGGPRDVSIEWNDYTDPNNVFQIGTTNSVKYIPKKIGLNIFEVKTKLIFDSTGNACDVAVNSENIEVFVFDKYTTSVSAEFGTCGDFSAQLKATVINSTGQTITSYPTPDGYIGQWAITGTGYTLVDSNTTDGIDAIKDPNAILSATGAGTFNASWTLIATAKNEANVLYANPETCPPVVTPLDIVIEGCIALDFDGQDDFIVIDNAYTDVVSIEAWIRPEVAAGTIISGPNFRITTPAGVIPNSRWYHIAVTGGKLYIDGIEKGPLTLGTGGTKTLIGADWTDGAATNHFSGWIEEVRLWKKALTVEQIRFMMNQRLIPNGVQMGEQIPMDVPGGLTYADLSGYYRLISAVPDLLANSPVLYLDIDKPANGLTPDRALTKAPGRLINMETNQENTAPLPYYSGANGVWGADATWLRPTVWDPPHTGPIEWNIVRTSHDIQSGQREIKILGLVSEINTLEMIGSNPGGWVGGGTGNPLYISHYLKLDGVIDLNGESQLLQPQGSIVDGNSSGSLQRDQQGTANSYNYNYWSSPVSPGANNAPYTVAGVLKDGTDPANPGPITFGNPFAFADAGKTDPIKISNYWISTFNGTVDNYGSWNFQYGSAKPIKVGEGYTMKGTSGKVPLSTAQNYTFVGLPNNGDIDLASFSERNYLLGNPYPSAIDAKKFITDNINVGDSRLNYFDGTLYFWNHFGKEDSHILLEYVGGYAALNLTGAVPAISFDERINNNMRPDDKIPGPYIPVGQGFFVNTSNGDQYTVSSGQIKFQNSQREFVTEVKTTDSQFLRPGVHTKDSKIEEVEKIRISFKSPLGYYRQILVGAIPFTTNGFDLGYDAPLYDYNPEDMYWIQGNNWLVIQGVPDFNKEQILPLGVNLKDKGEFSIQIDKLENFADDKMVYLHDKVMDSVHDLRKSAYKATAEGGYHNERFEIVFYKEVVTAEEPPVVIKPDPGIPDGGGQGGEEVTTLTIRHSNTRKEIQILNPDQVPLSNMYIFDMTGKQVMHHRNISHDKEVILPVRNYSSGIYTIKLYTDGKAITKKIIIGN